MDEKYVNRFLRREFRVIGWLLVAYYGIMNILTVAAVFSDVLRQFLQSLSRGQFPGNPDIHALMGNGWGYVATVAVGLLFLFCWKEDRFWKESVLASHGKMTVGVFAVLACLCMAAQLVNSLWIAGLELVMNQFDRSVMDILESVSGQSDTFSMFLYASILAPVSEELIFRGYILQTLRPYGKKFAIVLSAFLFGIFHGNLLQTPYAFLMGLVLGYVTVEYHIGWAVALHVFNNLVLADLLTRLTGGLSEQASEAVSLVLLGGAAIAAGVVLIVKRNRIGEYIRSDWMDRRCVKCFFTNSGVIVLMVLMALNVLTVMGL